MSAAFDLNDDDFEPPDVARGSSSAAVDNDEPIVGSSNDAVVHEHRENKRIKCFAFVVAVVGRTHDVSNFVHAIKEFFVLLLRFEI